MATISISLIFKEGDLYYKTAKMPDYEPMAENSVVGADPGDTVQWTCADESIDKINNIKVNKTKSTARNWKDIWDSKPSATDSSKRTFEGVVKSTQPDEYEYNGYDINYKVKNGGDKEKDPEVQVPQT